jgi:mRNA-degrading endonuclease toxin of MazEF toxin-antitoxin module
LIPGPLKPARGQVAIVDFSSDAQGREQTKIRPAVIISTDFFNDRLDTIIVIPISSLKEGATPREHEVFIKKDEGGLDVDSVAQPIQVRTVDRKFRVKKLLGRLPPATMRQIIAKLGEAVGATPGP